MFFDVMGNVCLVVECLVWLLYRNMVIVVIVVGIVMIRNSSWNLMFVVSKMLFISVLYIELRWFMFSV